MGQVLISKREKLLLKAIFFLFVLEFGGILNIKAVTSNGGMMPMYTKIPYAFSADSGHFTFTNKSDVQFFILTDIINIPLTNFYSSIGDIVLWIGIIGFIACIISYGRIVNRDSKSPVQCLKSLN